MSGSDGARLHIVVSAGTDFHPFDRLMGWVERWLATSPGTHVLVQHGSSRPPRGVEAVPMLSQEDLRCWMQGADAVVVQAGPGGIIDSLRCGRRPLVVPRLASLGECVDDHQVAFARHLAAQDKVLLAETEQQFRAQLDRIGRDPAIVRIEPYPGPGPETALRVGALVGRLVSGGSPPAEVGGSVGAAATGDAALW